METPPYTPMSDQDTPPSTPHILRHNWEEALRAAAEEDYTQGEIEAAIMAARGAFDQPRQPARRRRASPSRASEGVGESKASIRAVRRDRQTSSRPASRTTSRSTSRTTLRPSSRTTSRPASRALQSASRASSQPASRPIAQPTLPIAAAPVMVPTVVSQTEEARRQSQMRNLTRYNPPRYTGRGTEVQSEEWMRAFTKILDAMGVTADADRVRIASLHLDAQADEWWEGMTRARRAKTYTWDEFVRAFYVRFFPRATRQDLADRFQNLKQGDNQSITDYHSRFIQLGRFAPQSVVADESGMTWKFHKGLKPEYRIHLASHDHEQVELLKNAALKMETEYRSTPVIRPRQPGHSDRPGKRPQTQQHRSASNAPPVFAALPEQAHTAPLLQAQT